jgi:hypothetical protein
MYPSDIWVYVTKLLGSKYVVKLNIVSTNYFLQRMHYLLKNKILQFVFKCFT